MIKKAIIKSIKSITSYWIQEIKENPIVFIITVTLWYIIYMLNNFN